jgi:alpha-L-rhamnosidase
MKSSNNNGLTWSAAKGFAGRFLGPVKNKPVMLKDGTLIAPSSTESNGWKMHFEISKDTGKPGRWLEPVPNDLGLDAVQPTVWSIKLEVAGIGKRQAESNCRIMVS